MAYYFLISSLPVLNPLEKLPLSYNDFLEQCKPSVSESTYKQLSELSLDSHGNQLLSIWNKFYSSLIEELNYRRAEMLQKPQIFKKHDEPEIVSVIDDVFKADNPLEAEKIMLKAQFSFLDESVLMHYFDSYVLFGYAIKMKLMQRQQLFAFENGKNELNGLLANIQNTIQEL